MTPCTHVGQYSIQHAGGEKNGDNKYILMEVYFLESRLTTSGWVLFKFVVKCIHHIITSKRLRHAYCRQIRYKNGIQWLDLSKQIKVRKRVLYKLNTSGWHLFHCLPLGSNSVAPAIPPKRHLADKTARGHMH